MIRIFIAALIAVAVSSAGTWFLIQFLTDRSLGQPIHDDVPEGHMKKAGTPTMGGIAIVLAAVVSYFISGYYRGIYTVRGILVIGAIAGAGLVGFLDDYIKVRNERNVGLNKRAKMVGLLTVAILFAVLVVTQTEQHTQLSFTRFDNFSWGELGQLGWAIWAVFLITGFSNGVNLTDGLDGLAAGAGIFAFSAFVVVGFWTFRHPEVYDLVVGQQPFGLDLAVIAAAMVGALAGFLWWNTSPAKIVMGDTGSLAIGTGLACLALTTNTALLLPIVGALFVTETVSVMLQVGSFRLFGGKRIFRMAPIHHHFELGGWPEVTVIVRFWMMSAACSAAGIGLFYRDFLVVTGSLS